MKWTHKILVFTAARVAALLVAGALGWNSLRDGRTADLEQAIAALIVSGVTAISLCNQRKLLRTRPPEDP